MKTQPILIKCLLIFAIGLTSVVAQSLPPKSSISIRATESTAPPEAVGQKCKRGFEKVEYLPTVMLGSDSGGNAQFRLFALVDGGKDDRTVKLYPVLTQSLSSGSKVLTASLSKEKWLCSCCRPLNKEKPKVVGWVAELEKDGTILCRVQSGNTPAIFQALEKRELAPATSIFSGEMNADNISKDGRSSVVLQPIEMARISTKNGQIADVQFTGTKGERAFYRWRYQASPTSPLREGTGEVRRSVPPSVEDNLNLSLGDLFATWRPSSTPGSNEIAYSTDLATVSKLPEVAFGTRLVNVSEPEAVGRVSGYAIKPGQVIRVSSFGAQAVIQFTEIADSTVKYRWRYQARDSSTIETGEGAVTESFVMETRPDGTVRKKAAADHNPWVRAGDIALRWSQKSVFFDPYSTVERLPAEAFAPLLADNSASSTLSSIEKTETASAEAVGNQPNSKVTADSANDTGKPSNHLKPWTSEEEQTLRDEVSAGKGIEEIAIAHGRTPRAISTRLKKLGLNSLQ